MSPTLRVGVSVVFLALACYTIGVIAVRRRRAISTRALRFLVAGVVFDVTATAFMILGSGRLITLHGVIGYSALAAMVVDTWLAWRHRRAAGDGPVPAWLHRYTLGAYIWWVVAFITGAVLVGVSRASS